MAARRYPHPVARDGLGESISGLASDTAQLVRLEVELFKQEMLELLKRNAIGIGALLGAAVALFIGFIFVQVWVIELVPHHAWAAIGFALGWILIATVAALYGKSRIKFAPPETTIQSIKEDVEWVKQQIKPAPR